MAALRKLYLWMLPQCLFALELQNDIVDVKAIPIFSIYVWPHCLLPTTQLLNA
jgi:hypothetical protein